MDENFREKNLTHTPTDNIRDSQELRRLILINKLLSYHRCMDDYDTSPLLKNLNVDYSIIHNSYSVFDYDVYFSLMSIYRNYAYNTGNYNMQLHESLMPGFSNKMKRVWTPG